LKNPLSVQLGIGPVCRAREGLQGEFDFMHAQIELIEHAEGKYILVRDVGHNGGRTVTNDPEYIVKLIYEDYGITDGTRIFYIDSEETVNELRHSGKRFTGYKSGHEGVALGAA
jgi:hypothetical protein